MDLNRQWSRWYGHMHADVVLTAKIWLGSCGWVPRLCTSQEEVQAHKSGIKLHVMGKKVDGVVKFQCDGQKDLDGGMKVQCVGIILIHGLDKDSSSHEDKNTLDIHWRGGEGLHSGVY